MIKVKAIFENETAKPSNVIEGKGNHHFDGVYFIYFESEKERETYLSEIKIIISKEDLNRQQLEELLLTDWFFIRKVELGIDVPNEIIEQRLAIRKKYDDLKILYNL